MSTLSTFYHHPHSPILTHIQTGPLGAFSNFLTLAHSSVDPELGQFVVQYLVQGHLTCGLGCHGGYIHLLCGLRFCTDMMLASDLEWVRGISTLKVPTDITLASASSIT